jgi:gamma-glutamylcyclotransferase (GGCT)/AIG2-like uncharacterized protein YtfP
LGEDGFLPAIEGLTMAIYFAYGSNLDARNWREFCARHNANPKSMQPIGPALLPDCELVFNYRSVLRSGGALNIRERKGHFVHGALFEVSDHGWEVLDLKESVAAGCYRRISHMAIVAGGRTVPVVTYQVTRQRTEDGFVAPSDEYTGIVRRGLAAFGLPSHQYEKAAVNERAEAEVDSVFVYGTLMRGESRHAALERHKPAELDAAHAHGRLHATAADYPMLDVHGDDPAGLVRGEFARFPDTGPVLETLDEVEVFHGYARDGHEYVRTLLEVVTARGARRLAWTYVAGDRSMMAERIDSGCWRTHRAASRAVAGAESPA